jgi:hypothetical protein
MKICKCCDEEIPEGTEWKVEEMIDGDFEVYYLCEDCNEMLADMGE